MSDLSDTATPLVSVVIPLFRAERWIEATLRSVLQQTYEHFEIVVVDDGSPDASASIVEELMATDDRIRLLRRDNAGPSAARNAGVAAARGALVAPLDSDDLWRPRKLELQVARFLQAAADGVELTFVYCWSDAVDEQGAPCPPRLSRATLEGDVFDALSESHFVSCGSAALIRRDALVQAGGYPEAMRAGCEDWTVHLLLAKRGPVGVVPEVLVGYRQVLSSRSRTRDLSRLIEGQRSMAACLSQRGCGLSKQAEHRQRLQLIAFTLLRSLPVTSRGFWRSFYRSLRFDPLFLLRPYVWRRALASRRANRS